MLSSLSNLYTCCIQGDAEQLKRLVIKEGHDPSRPDSSGICPLHYAVTSNQLECAHILLAEFGCSPNVLDGSGMTPLHQACSLANADMVKLLIKSNDIDLVKN